MVRNTSLLAMAAAVASLPGPAAGVLCTNNGALFSNPNCALYDHATCLVNPGCLWNGTNAFGGVCRGGPACPFQTIKDICKSLLTCSWVAADMPQVNSSCTGDGTAYENPLCKLYDQAACVVSSGCNWLRQNIYGGWCSGGPQCTYVSPAFSCHLVPGCSWTLAEGVAPLPPAQYGDCRGSGGPWSNLACRLYGRTTCFYSPGCNWKGATAYGGWCTGGPQCTHVVPADACSAVPGCAWVPSNDAASTTLPARVPGATLAGAAVDR